MITTYEKKISVSGQNGEVTGKIVVSMNHSSKIISGTNAITHDDYTEKKYYHKVMGYINDKLIYESLELPNEPAVLIEVSKYTQRLSTDMFAMAHNNSKATFTEIMSDLGFKK